MSVPVSRPSTIAVVFKWDPDCRDQRAAGTWAMMDLRDMVAMPEILSLDRPQFCPLGRSVLWTFYMRCHLERRLVFRQDYIGVFGRLDAGKMFEQISRRIL